jgi:hypothetical protein
VYRGVLRHGFLPKRDLHYALFDVAGLGQGFAEPALSGLPGRDMRCVCGVVGSAHSGFLMMSADSPRFSTAFCQSAVYAHEPYRRESAMTDVLLTGATGFVGQHLLRELVAAGHRVRGLSRSEAGDAAVRALGGHPVRGVLGDESAGARTDLQRAVDGCAAVFHTAADTTQWRPHNPVQTQTNVRGVELLLAASEAAGVSRFLHTRSVSA